MEVNLSCLDTKHRSPGAPFPRQPAINWIFTQTKLSSIYRRKFLCLDEASRIACNSDETQTINSMAKSLQACGKRRETLKF